MRRKAGTVTLTAPDGKTFTSRSEYRKYLATVLYSFSDKKGEKLVKKPGEISGQGFTFRNLVDCEMLLLDHSERGQAGGVEEDGRRLDLHVAQARLEVVERLVRVDGAGGAHHAK